MTVYLVGAGPGDPGLLTVRGAELLAIADVVVYDRLASPRLLDLAPAAAERIDVGKAPGGVAMAQADIDRLLVDRGQTGATVVRLKGGDPFVFGRGGEEAEALISAGVPFEVVPGVTSAIAAPRTRGYPSPIAGSRRTSRSSPATKIPPKTRPTPTGMRSARPAAPSWCSWAPVESRRSRSS